VSYLLVFITISTLILIHESGHLLAARWSGIPIARFSVGYGPKVWGTKIGETEYWLSLIPCGGYVLPAVEDEKEFDRLPLGARLGFAVGGPGANILGAFIFWSLISVLRVGLSPQALLILPLQHTWQSIVQIATSLPMLFGQPDRLSGIVGIVTMGGNTVGLDPIRLLQLCAFLNVNLAILNLLPILPLDGGKIAMGILKKLYSPLARLEIPFALTGWAMLMGLVLYATILDISRIVTNIHI
jgi:regulator of sigma E protease